MVVQGFNTDLNIIGFHFHIQTEDWGEDNPIIVTRVFREGAVIKSLKVPYDIKTLKRNYLDYSKVLRQQMKEQHDKCVYEVQAERLVSF